jgi:hypothetical protein
MFFGEYVRLMAADLAVIEHIRARDEGFIPELSWGVSLSPL